MSTTPSYVLPAAAAALAHAAGSTIRDDGAAQSLLPLLPHVYAPAQSGDPSAPKGTARYSHAPAP